MLTKPINSALKEYFMKLFNKANEDAKNDYSSEVETKLKGLDLFNQIKFLVDEQSKLEEKTKFNEHPYYIENHSSEEWLLNQFASRTFLLNVDESAQIYECVRLGAYRNLISTEKHRLLESVPKYTFSEFIKGKIDPYFSNFENLYNIPEEDYYQIRNWQTEKLIKIISYESSMLIKQIQQYCETLPKPLDFIISEKEKIDKLEKTKPEAATIKTFLSDLFIFKGINPDIFDNNTLEESHKIYTTEQINWRLISPTYINILIEKVDQKANYVFSNESTIFFTINKISQWFDDVIKGQALQQEIKTIDWTFEFENIKKNAEKQIDVLVNKIDKFVSKPKISKDEIKDYLIDQLQTYRQKFNDFEAKYCFALLEEEKEKTLKLMFITNSFFGNALKEQSDLITNAIIIHKMSWEIVGYYGSIFKTRCIGDLGNKSHAEIMFLLHQMVLDKEIHEEYTKCMHDFMQHFHSFRLPIEIHLENIKDSLAEIFNKSINRLLAILDDSEPTNKILYLQSRIKQLKQRELQFKQFEILENSSEDDYYYTSLFKDFLEIEADFIRETKDVQFFPALTPGNKQKQIALTPLQIEPKPTPVKINSFYYKECTRQADNIKNLCSALIKNNFIPEDTNKQDFQKIFRNEKPDTPIQWLGNLSELKYFIKLLNDEFQVIDDLKNDIWKVTASVFIDINKNPFDFRKFRKQQDPSKKDILQRIARNL